MPDTQAAWFTVEQYGEVEITHMVPGYAWRCYRCGWLGEGLISPSSAEREARQHIEADHADA
jgi:hypothetical protein